MDRATLGETSNSAIPRDKHFATAAASTRSWTMSTDNETRDDKSDNKERPQNTPNEHRQPPRSIFAIPAPIKQLFDKFPLLSYPANELPQRAPGFRNENVLYIWTTEDAAMNGAPSYNPQCLKWQVR